MTLEPRGNSTRRVATGDLKCAFRWVGGGVERAIASGLEEHAAADADLLRRCVARRAR